MTAQADRLRRRAAREGFQASSEPEVGRLLAALASSKPGGMFLELGTNRPASHKASVDALTARLASLPGWRSFRTDLGSGVMVCVRCATE